MSFPKLCAAHCLIPHNSGVSGGRGVQLCFSGEPLFTSTGWKITNGYFRVEFGGRGPYVEFNAEDVSYGAFQLTGNRHLYYSEYRTPDAAYVKIYCQKLAVSYARYQPGSYYVDLLDVHRQDGSPAFDKTNQELLKEIERRRNT